MKTDSKKIFITNSQEGDNSKVATSFFTEHDLC